MKAKCVVWAAAAVFLLPGAVLATGPDVVLQWQDEFLAAAKLRNAFLTNSSGQTIQADDPPLTSRSMALLNTSIFNAVNTIDRRYQFYQYNPAAAPAGASREAAAIEAARRVMVQEFPNRLGAINSRYNTQIDALLDAGVSLSSINAGLAVGEAAANHVLSLRQGDNSSPMATWPESNVYGKYRTDLFGAETNVPAAQPQWGTVTPWAIDAGNQFRSTAIPAFNSPEYAAAVEEVRIHGDRARYQGSNLPADVAWEKRTAFFWAQKGLNPSGIKVSTGTTTPPGQWLQIARSVAGTRSDDLLDNARLMALLSLTVADAGIVAWDTKYAPENNLWRPIHAIRLASVTDPNDPNYNPGISVDPTWMPLIPTSNHPEYVSGHSTFSGAAAELLTLYFGENVMFSVIGDDALFLDGSGNIVSPGTPGATREVRTYSSFWDAAEEAGQSRIYGGIHYQFSNQHGLNAGRGVGGWVFGRALAPIPEPSSLSLLLIPAVLLGGRRRH
jgi:hypothetical protein